MEKIFQHGIASGDPLQDRVVLWTRLGVPRHDPIDVTWELAADAGFKNVIQAGETVEHGKHDFTVHFDHAGLQPGTYYYYRCNSLDECCPTGRTKSLQSSCVHHLCYA